MESISPSQPWTQPRGGFFDLTVQWSIIAESLRRSSHPKGEHGYGSLIQGSSGARYSFHHNLWAHHQARMPRIGNYASAKLKLSICSDKTSNYESCNEKNLFHKSGCFVLFLGYKLNGCKHNIWFFIFKIKIP